MCCGAVQQPVESLQYPLECGQSGVISCKICPSMVEVLLPGPCLPADVRRKIAEVISVSTDDVELYFLEGKRLVAVHDNRLGISVYHALLRLRGGKGGFRKQLEKKGRAFARSKRLRNATLNQDRERQINTTSGNLVTTNEQHARDVSVKSKKVSPLLVSDVNMKEAVCCGIKRVVHKIKHSSQ
uniref:Uncharacterized protein n=1 Tax=Trypanosoma congolense (strain IL3000) TaxID=1068625 RepID=G0UN12_TRYCI|nr:conserved hypothetical protein [Trypanosoma congolense IL3000]